MKFSPQQRHIISIFSEEEFISYEIFVSVTSTVNVFNYILFFRDWCSRNKYFVKDETLFCSKDTWNYSINNIYLMHSGNNVSSVYRYIYK